MTFKKLLRIAGLLFGALFLTACTTTGDSATAAKPKAQITVIYDAFGKDNSLKKDWGYAALIEVGGKRILFDTGNDGEVFAHNVKAKGIDLSRLDFVVLSHRHSDHMAGLNKVLAANPDVKIYAPKEGFGIYGSSLPGSFYRKDATLPAEYRYFDGKPADTLKFGTAWENAKFFPTEQTTEIAPGVWLVALVSDVPGTRELRELSLAIDTPDGIVIIAGCSHPGIENIVQAASKINPRIHLITGGFHLVNAQDEAITKIAASLRDQWKVDYIAPGHCTGEPTFNALRKAFGDRYLYAGVGTVLKLGSEITSSGTRGQSAALRGEELSAYQALAAVSHDARDTQLAHAGHAHLH